MHQAKVIEDTLLEMFRQATMEQRQVVKWKNVVVEEQGERIIHPRMLPSCEACACTPSTMKTPIVTADRE